MQCAGGRIADCRVIEVLGDSFTGATDHQHPRARRHRESTRHPCHLHRCRSGRDCRLLCVWAWMRQGASALWLVRPPSSRASRLALLTLALRFCGAGLRSCGGVYIAASLLWLWLIEKQRGRLGPDRCRNLPRRCGRHPVGAEGGWWMIGVLSRSRQPTAAHRCRHHDRANLCGRTRSSSVAAVRIKKINDLYWRRLDVRPIPPPTSRHNPFLRSPRVAEISRCFERYSGRPPDSA